MGTYIILMGVQGAGKGVQASFIKDTYHIPHVSTGDLFRAMRTREDEFAKSVIHRIDNGILIDDETTNKMVEERLSQDDAKEGVILDGYPRNQVQAEFLDGLLADKGGLTAVLYLDLNLYTAFKRAFGRVKDADGNTYNIYFQNENLEVSNAKDDSGVYPPRVVAIKDGAELKRRADDADADAVVKRIDTYLANTQPLIDYYDSKGALIKIEAEQSIEAVSQDIKVAIDNAKS